MPKTAALALLLALSAPGIALAAPGDGQDRYGPPPPAYADADMAGAPQALLTWPGKASPSQPLPMAAPIRRQPLAMVDSGPLPPPSPLTAQALPTSIYAPAPPPSPLMAAQQPAQTMAAPEPPPGQPPRLYSLHREYGLTPDPAPALLPTQFFTPTADLAEPPPPPPPHVLPAGQSAMTASARARADESDPEAAPATLDNSTP
jgi:hypothetical protein